MFPELAKMKNNKFKLVYLAHPFISAPQKNFRKINAIARKIIKIQLNYRKRIKYVPFVPHNILSVFTEQENPALRPITENLSCRLVSFCDELWICSPIISAGMQLEIKEAKQRKIKIVSYRKPDKFLIK